MVLVSWAWWSSRPTPHEIAQGQQLEQHFHDGTARGFAQDQQLEQYLQHVTIVVLCTVENCTLHGRELYSAR